MKTSNKSYFYPLMPFGVIRFSWKTTSVQFGKRYFLWNSYDSWNHFSFSLPNILPLSTTFHIQIWESKLNNKCLKKFSVENTEFRLLIRHYKSFSWTCSALKSNAKNHMIRVSAFFTANIKTVFSNIFFFGVLGSIIMVIFQ